MAAQDGDTSRAAHILTVSMYYEVMKQKWAFEKTLVSWFVYENIFPITFLEFNLINQIP